jgi:methylenetetrahydrofolate dehydrogenase (NADP+) / methenyltetrahydrofolate cyclohydrolase
MKIDGKAIAEKIYADLTERVGELKKTNITPALAVILIGDDPGSVNYVAQKEKHAKKIGLDIHIDRISTDISQNELDDKIQRLNSDPTIHGIIVQRPAPEQITKEFLDTAVIPEKDVDGFHHESDFAAPVALAVEHILYIVFTLTEEQHDRDSFSSWLMSKSIVVLGKGETAGMPIITHFHGRNAQITVIDSATADPIDIIKNADVIISAVGKPAILTSDILSEKAIVIGVGLHEEVGKLHGDYSEADISGKAAFYTPTPGGVGPVNVAMLLANVVRAAEEQAPV